MKPYRRDYIFLELPSSHAPNPSAVSSLVLTEVEQYKHLKQRQHEFVR